MEPEKKSPDPFLLKLLVFIGGGIILGIVLVNGLALTIYLVLARPELLETPPGAWPFLDQAIALSIVVLSFLFGGITGLSVLQNRAWRIP